jgi:hypothetical protein
MSAETIGDIAFTTKDGNAFAAPKQPDIGKVIPFSAPAFYSPKPSQLQRASFDPRSTSHSYVAKMGYAKSF